MIKSTNKSREIDAAYAKREADKKAQEDAMWAAHEKKKR